MHETRIHSKLFFFFFFFFCLLCLVFFLNVFVSSTHTVRYLFFFNWDGDGGRGRGGTVGPRMVGGLVTGVTRPPCVEVEARTNDNNSKKKTKIDHISFSVHPFVVRMFFFFFTATFFMF